MATPSYKELLEGSTQWRKEHLGISYLLSHHGYREAGSLGGMFDDEHPGIWCYYLLIPEQMYPHRWDDFKARPNEYGHLSPGPAWDSVEFDSEITFASSEPRFDRKTGKTWDAIKVGCDYAHLWHSEAGYPDTYPSVNADAIATVESLRKAHPDFNLRCKWSGIWDTSENFYEAANGYLVHVSKEEEASGKYPNYARKDHAQPKSAQQTPPVEKET